MQEAHSIFVGRKTTSIMNSASLDYIEETEFENDPFGEVDESQLQADIHSYANYSIFYLIVMGYLRIVLCLLVITADIFLAVAICRFKTLQTRINMYILNGIVLNILCNLVGPVYFTLFHLLLDHDVPAMFFLQTHSTLMILYATSAICLAIDWFLSSSRPNFVQKYNRFYKYVFAGVYWIFFVEWLFAFIYSKWHHTARTASFTIFYLIYLIVLISLNIMKRKINLHTDSGNTAYALTTANIVFFSFLPFLLFHSLLNLNLGGDFLWTLVHFEFIPEYISIAHPILVVYMLGRQSKHFSDAYKKSFSRSVTNDEDGSLKSISENRNVVEIRKVNYLNGNQDDIKV